MNRRVGIIGCGAVGTSIAISTLHSGAARELLLHDLRTAVAEGEAMDLSHGAAFYPACRVRSVALDELREADVVVVAAGRNGSPTQSRLELLRDNAKVVKDIGASLRGFAGIIVMVSNPVDVLTSVMAAASGLPPERVIGTGTMLDTSRLRQRLGLELDVATSSVHAQVVGEHGDTEVVLWSTAAVGGRRLGEWPGWAPEREAGIAHDVRRAAYEVIARKGVTNHAIGLVTASLLRCIMNDERRVLTVSRCQQGALGFSDVALSLPAVVGALGAQVIAVPSVNEAEGAALAASAQTLREALASLGGQPLA